jgi:hypothetical protein
MASIPSAVIKAATREAEGAVAQAVAKRFCLQDREGYSPGNDPPGIEWSFFGTCQPCGGQHTSVLRATLGNSSYLLGRRPPGNGFGIGSPAVGTTKELRNLGI